MISKKVKKINIQLSEQTEKKLDAVFTAISHIRSTYPYIATAVTDEEFAKIQKTISDIKLGMSKFSYKINNFITNHYHCYGNEIINEIINAIEKMNKIGNDGNEIIKKIKKMNEIDNNEFVKIDITDIIPDLLDIVNNIYDIQCWPFYYKEGLNFK